MARARFLRRPPIMTLPPLGILKSFSRAPGVVRGMTLMVLATMCPAISAPAVRHVSQGLHPFEIAFFSAVFALLAFLPLFARRGLAPLKTVRFPLQALRGALYVIDILMIYLAISLSPLAKVTALDFSAPLFATLLAMLVLGEKVRARRVAALAVGFAGTLVILRPGLVEADLGALCALVAASGWGLSIVVVKMLSRTDSAVTTTIYTLALAIPLTLIAALPFWTAPTPTQLAWLALIGGVGCLNHLLVNQAFKEADLTAVLPLNFLKLIWISAAAYALFGEVPDLWTWVGAVTIFAAASYLSLRERRLAGAGRRGAAATLSRRTRRAPPPRKSSPTGSACRPRRARRSRSR